jgi:hypothetical protein
VIVWWVVVVLLVTAAAVGYTVRAEIDLWRRSPSRRGGTIDFSRKRVGA